METQDIIQPMEVRRSLPFSLEFANTGKKNFLYELRKEYKRVIELLLKLGAKKKKLAYEDTKLIDSWLSARYKGFALKQAQSMLKSWIKKPEIKKLPIKLDSRFFKFEKGKNSFDYWLLIRGPRKEEWITFPVKSYDYAKGYFENWQRADFVEIKKLITTSDGQTYGREIKEIIEKRIDRKEQGSKPFKRAKHFLKTEINRILKSVIDGSFSPVFENLKNLKKGKAKGWVRSVNRRFNHSQYTSRACPVCTCTDKRNQKGKCFKCASCGYSAPADYVGALNIFLRFTPAKLVPIKWNNCL